MRKLTFYLTSMAIVLLLFWKLFYLISSMKNSVEIEVAKNYLDVASYEVLTLDKETCWREPDFSNMTPLIKVNCVFSETASRLQLKYRKIFASVKELPNGIRTDVEIILPASIENYDQEDVLAYCDSSLDCYDIYVSSLGCCYDIIERELVLDGGVAVLKSSYWLFFDIDETPPETSSFMTAQVAQPR